MKIHFKSLMPEVLSGDKIQQRNYILGILICKINVTIAMGVNVYNFTAFLTLYPSSLIPYWMLGDSIILIIIGEITNWYNPKNIKKYVICVNYILITTIIIIFFLNLTSWSFVPLTTIFTLKAVSSMTGIISWSLMSVLFYHNQYKSVVNYLTIAGSLSSIISPIIIAQIVILMSLESMIQILLFLLVSSAILIFFTHDIMTAQKENRVQKTSTSPFQYPLFKTLYILTLVFYILGYLADFFFRKELAIHFNKNDITIITSVFLTVTNLISLTMLLFAPFIQSKFKFYMVLQFTFSLVSIIGLIYFLDQNLSWPIIALNTVLTAFSYGYFSTTTKSIRNIFPQSIIIKGDIYLKSYGTAYASIFVSVLAIIARQIYNLSLLFVVLSLSAIFISYQLFVRYLDTLKQMLVKSNFNIAKINTA